MTLSKARRNDRGSASPQSVPSHYLFPEHKTKSRRETAHG